MNDPMILRPVEISDIPLIKTCFEMASDGLAQHFWEQAREAGETIDEVAERRVRAKIEEPANFVRVAGDGFGSVISYQVGDDPESVEGVPSIIKPLIELENLALGSHYINMIAVLPAHQRMGIARHLINAVRQHAGGRRMSLIVADSNVSARALYRSEGFRDVATAPMISNGWQAPGEDWILMLTES